MIGDPFLNYFALGTLFFVVIVLFYGINAIDARPVVSGSRPGPGVGRRRTGQADRPHPALGQDFTPSPTACRGQARSGVRGPPVRVIDPHSRNWHFPAATRSARQRNSRTLSRNLLCSLRGISRQLTAHAGNPDPSQRIGHERCTRCTDKVRGGTQRNRACCR
jgi:hypothetical protein